MSSSWKLCISSHHVARFSVERLAYAWLLLRSSSTWQDVLVLIQAGEGAVQSCGAVGCGGCHIVVVDDASVSSTWHQNLIRLLLRLSRITYYYRAKRRRRFVVKWSQAMQGATSNYRRGRRIFDHSYRREWKDFR